MTTVVFESGIRMFRGGMGGFVYRRHADGSVTVVRASVPNPDRVPTAAQIAHQDAFKVAVARAKVLAEDSKALAAYQLLQTRRGPLSNLRAMMIGDILRPPSIKTLDVSSYHGAIGDPIHIVAQDNFAVARLEIAIQDQTEAQEIERLVKLFSGPQLGPTVEWRYTAITAATAGHTLEVSVTAYDLAGNATEQHQTVTI